MARTDSPTEAARSLPQLVRQRWRIVYRRTKQAAELSQRDLEDAWLAALAASRLPLAPTGQAGRRPKVAFGPPIPVGATGERELVDIYLCERVALAEVEERLRNVVPDGCELVVVHDVWVGAPALQAAVVALDYRVEITVEPAVLPAAIQVLRAAAATILAARTLPQTRVRGGRVRDYDLRPMILDLRVGRVAEDRVGIEMRLRVDPAAGVGRPDAVVRALIEVAEAGAAAGAGALASHGNGGALEALKRATTAWLGPVTGVVGAAARPGDEVGDATPRRQPSPTTDGHASRVSGVGGAVRVVRERLITADEAESVRPVSFTGL